KWVGSISNLITQQSRTPAMLIDGTLLPGYLPYEKLYQIVKAKLEEKSK
ncbi:DsbA family protein, partial [Vibrio splendidus]